MDKHLGIAITGLLLALILGALVWRAWRKPESGSQAQRLTGLLKELREGRSVETEKALRQIGTNALPVLLEMARATNSNARAAFLGLVRRQSALAFDFRDASEAHDLAAIGFCVLGPVATGAVPALTNLLNSADPELQRTASACLGCIGPAAEDAVPALVREISNADRLVRATAKHALGNIHGQPVVAVPALVANLSLRDGSTHLTLMASGHYGGEAKAAVPALLLFLNDSNANIRSSASNALIQIDREAATSAGVR